MASDSTQLTVRRVSSIQVALAAHCRSPPRSTCKFTGAHESSPLLTSRKLTESDDLVRTTLLPSPSRKTPRDQLQRARPVSHPSTSFLYFVISRTLRRYDAWLYEAMEYKNNGTKISGSKNHVVFCQDGWCVIESLSVLVNTE
jgi:hypothetical protein